MELKNWTGDNLHIDSDINQLDGYQKTWNAIVTERESGKSTLLWKKVYNTFKRERRPSIVFRRYQTDITDAYIDDVTTIINSFTKQDLKLKFKKGDLKSGGMANVYIEGFDEVFCRIVALNAPLSRLKSMRLDKVKYFMYDEFICNIRIGEKYLNDEPLRVKELYTTYNRHTIEYGLPPIKIYMFGNPYSLFNPFFSDLNVNTNKLYPGAFITENDYCVWCYQIKPELKEKILKNNPLYRFDDAYKKYAFDGRAVQDNYIRVERIQPEGFKLNFVFKIHNKCLAIYRGFRVDGEDKLFYWVKKIDENSISRRRDIVCFDFGDMANRTVLNTNNGKIRYQMLKESIEHRWIAFYSVEESWLIEEIYQEL